MIKPRCDCESSRGGVLLYPDAEHKALKSRRVNGIIKEIVPDQYMIIEYDKPIIVSIKCWGEIDEVKYNR